MGKTEGISRRDSSLVYGSRTPSTHSLSSGPLQLGGKCRCVEKNNKVLNFPDFLFVLSIKRLESLRLRGCQGISIRVSCQVTSYPSLCLTQRRKGLERRKQITRDKETKWVFWRRRHDIGGLRLEFWLNRTMVRSDSLRGLSPFKTVPKKLLHSLLV